MFEINNSRFLSFKVFIGCIARGILTHLEQVDGFQIAMKTS